MPKVTRKCAHCGMEFVTTESRIKEAAKKGHEVAYCSVSCGKYSPRRMVAKGFRDTNFKMFR